MNRRTKFILVTVVLLTAGLAWLLKPRNQAQKAVAKNLRALHEQGFRTQLNEFDLSLTPEQKVRSATLMKAGEEIRGFGARGLDMMRCIGSNYAIALVREEHLATESTEDWWPEMRTNLNSHVALLDAACEAALAGPVQFAHANLPLHYLGDYRSLAPALAQRVLLETHDDHPALAWTNLLGLTRLATAFETEPIELAYIMKFSCVAAAERATWESLQAHRWSGEELAGLAQEWKQLNVFGGMADIPEFACATALAYCEQERQRPPAPNVPLSQAASDLFSSPGRGWAELTIGWRDSRWRNYGVFEDENAAMTFYHDLKGEWRAATNAVTWEQMRSMPGVTNGALLNAARYSQSGMFMALSQSGRGSFGRQRLGLFARAAEAESRRRLVIIALALERYHLEQGNYPGKLSALAPKFLPEVPVDFMDGKPLRYQPDNDHHFVLYSTGLDCVDDGGQWREDTNAFTGSFRSFYRYEGPDLMWPRPATVAEAAAYREKHPVASETFSPGGGSGVPRDRPRSRNRPSL